ncbi:MAG: efflux RND transporter periplasmic adaptor subunit [Gammaproteobacteria bacterium]|nr:MAG: efflux RND transporter periplasmic adaptor subunit [Gammaproteobacteria bacterium]
MRMKINHYPRLLAVFVLLPMVFQVHAQQAPALVKLADALHMQVSAVIDVPGTVISRHDTRVAAEVEGRLLKVLEVGDRVKTGEVVARQDERDYQLTLDVAQADVAREQSRLAFLNKEVKRLSRLAKSDNVSATQLDQTQSDRDISRQELQAAKARVSRAEHDIERIQIRAPFDGVVTERYKRTGEWAESGDELVRIANETDLEITAHVPAVCVPYIHIDDELMMSSKNSASTASKARVRAIVPVGDLQSGLYEILLIPEQGQWKAGQSLRVTVPVDKPREALVVPRDALVIRRDSISVFKIVDQKAEKVSVKTGIASGQNIEVIGKLKAGDKVVIRGNERLQPGQQINIMNDKASGK